MDLFSKLSSWVKMKIYSENTEQSNFLEYKILILGDKSVGKTSVCNRFCLNEFSLEIKPSTTCECNVKIVKIFDQIIKLYIIDTIESVLSGDRHDLYSDVRGVIIVYDNTKTQSFEKLDKWLLDVKQRISPDLPILIIGHKKDLTFLRNVDFEEGQEKANKSNCEFLETTCLDDDSIDNAFKILVAKIYYQEMPDTKKNYFRLAVQDKFNQENQQKQDLSENNNNENKENKENKDNKENTK